MTAEPSTWPDTQRRKLPDVRVRFGDTSKRQASLAGGIACVLFSGIFVSIGAVVAAAYIGAIWSPWQDVPPEMHLLFGPVFALAGLFLTGMGISGITRWVQLRRNRRQYPDEPWMHDYPWPREGWQDGRLRQLLGQVGLYGFLLLFLLPFNTLLFRMAGHWTALLFGGVIVGIFDVLALGGIWYAARAVARYLRFGSSRLVYRSFPYFLGQPMEAEWQVQRALGTYERLVFILRCVQTVTEGSGDDSKIVRYQGWADCYLHEGPGQWLAGKTLPITFLLPEDAPPTCIDRDDPFHWELEVRVERAGLSFVGVYRVPVYRKTDATIVTC